MNREQIRKHLVYLYIQVMGLLLAFGYGRFGGSGGATTEGMFYIISITGAISGFYLVYLLFLYRSLRKYLILYVPFLGLSVIEVLLIKWG